MANVSKVVLNRWDAGIQASTKKPIVGGADRVINFDLARENGHMYPVKSWRELTNSNERNLEIKSIGATTTSLIGCGKSFTDWLSNSYSRRIEVSLDTTKVPSNTWGFFDLSELPAAFWDNVVNENEIRVTTGTNVQVPIDLKNFDLDAQQGWLWMRNLNSTFYIYYDSTIISKVTPDSTYGQYNTYAVDDFFDFDEQPDDTARSSKDGNDYATGASSTTTEWSVGVTASYKADPWGGYALDVSAATLNCDAVPVDSDNITTSFLWKTPTTLPATDDNLLTIDGALTYRIYYDNSRNAITFFTNRTTGTVNVDHTTTLSPNTWYLIQTWASNQVQGIAVNGVTVIDDTDTHLVYNIDYTSAENLELNPNSGLVKDFWIHDGQWSANQHTTQYNMYFNTLLDTSSAETYDASVQQYSGMALHKILHTQGAGDWEMFNLNGSIVRDLNYHPAAGVLVPLSDSVIRWVVSQNDPTLNNGNTGFYYLALLNTLAYNADEDLLSTNMQEDGESFLVSLYYPLENKFFFTKNSSQPGTIDATGTYASTPLTPAAFSTIESMAVWGEYLVYSSDFRQFAFVEINKTDLGDNVQDRIDLGTGRCRVAGTAKDSLFFVVENFTDQDEISADEISVDIMQYVGAGNVRQVSKWVLPSSMDGFYSTNYQAPVSNLTMRTKNGTVWYGRMKDRDGTIKTGFWGVHKNEQTGVLGFTLHSEMTVKENDSAEVVNVSTIGSRQFVLTDDYAIYSNDGGYDRESVWDSQVYSFESYDEKKKLRTVKISTEDLDTGQVYRVYYRTNLTDEWILLLTHDSGVTTQANKDAQGAYLKEFNEVQFRITSIDGSAPIKELEFTYEKIVQGN